mgnify:CR=1 FL=1
MGLLSIKAIVQCYVYSFALRLVGDPEAVHMSEKSAVVRTADRIENALSASVPKSAARRIHTRLLNAA